MMDGGIKIELNAVRLQQAVLCANCDVISDSPHEACLVCGSRSLLPLARVLGHVNAVSLPAVTRGEPEQQRALPDNVLVLMSLIAHRQRKRGQR